MVFFFVLTLITSLPGEDFVEATHFRNSFRKHLTAEHEQSIIMNNSTHNNYDDLASCPYAVSIFFTTVMALISLAAFIGNILVIASVYKTPSLRTSTNYYYVNMALSDFLASLITWPYYLTDEVITSSGSLLQGSLATVGCKVGVFFRLVTHLASILSLVLIAVDRFIATAFPLKAKLITRTIRAALLFVTWAIPIAYSPPVFFYFEMKKVGQQTICSFVWNRLAIIIYYITTIAFFFVVPFIAIVILYSRVMRVLRRRGPQPESTRDVNYNNSQQKRNKQNQNIMKIFKSIVAVFLVSFCFLGISLILKIIFPELFIKDKCKLIVGFCYYVFPLLSTAVNPLILFTFSTNFRHALQTLFPRSCRKIDNVIHVQPQVTNSL